MEKVAYLGPDGSYSSLAARKLCPDGKCVPYASFRLAMNAVLSGECTSAALPIENSLNGAVLANIDLLQSAEGVVATRETKLALDHRLAVLKGADIRGISRIYSHEQPLAQCSEYLFSTFPNARLISTPSTAASIEMIKSPSDAAIVGAHVKVDGIELTPRNIADSTNNYTVFLLVERGEVDEKKRSEKIYFSVTCRHASGALLDILEPMRAGGLNMTKIQSRPIKNYAGEYRFFIEVEGDYSSPSVRAVLGGVREISSSFKILGAY